MRFLKSILEAIKGNALWDALKVVLPMIASAAVAALGYSGVTKPSASTVVYVTFILSGFGGLLLTILKAVRRPVFSAQLGNGLEAKLLFVEADGIRKMYRNLEGVRYPLKSSSWPNYGEVWQFKHATLHALSQRVSVFTFRANMVFLTQGWDTDGVELFEVDENVSMADLLHALDDFCTFLKTKDGHKPPTIANLQSLAEKGPDGR